jgi:hypothetical protein
MIVHMVLWKYRADISDSVREEHLQKLQSLRDVVPGIEHFAVGPDFLHTPRSYDTGLLAHFTDRSVLDAYTVHPHHVEVVKFSNSIIETMAKVDFES